MKNIKRMLAVVLALVTILSLTACSKNELEGSWLATGGTALDAITGGMDIAELGMDMIFSFKEDGKLEITLSFMGESETMEGTWEVDGDTVTMIADGSPLTGSYKVNGDKCTMTFSDGTLEFTKKN